MKQRIESQQMVSIFPMTILKREDLSALSQSPRHVVDDLRFKVTYTTPRE